MHNNSDWVSDEDLLYRYFAHPEHLLNVSNTYTIVISVILEVEVSHRDIVGMREDFAWYFNEPSVVCVIGVKFLSQDRKYCSLIMLTHSDASHAYTDHTGTVPALRVMAVQWVRMPDGSVGVEQVWDLGILACSPQARLLWGQASSVVAELPTGPLMSLPPVLSNRWATRRFATVPQAVLMDLPAQHVPPLVNLPAEHTRGALVAAAARLIRRHLELGPNMVLLYGGNSPRVTISGELLVAFLHNVPAGTPPLGPLLGDLTLDFGFMVYAAQRAAPT